MYINHKNKKISIILMIFIIISNILFGDIQYITANEVAETNTDTAGSRRVIRVGYYIAPGFQDYDEETKEYSGTSYEFLMAIKQYTNWDYEFVPVQFSKAVVMLQNGELDLVNNVSKTAEREETLGFSTYASGSNYGCLIVNADNKKYAYNDYEAFDNIKVGYIKNSIFKEYFDDYCKEHNINANVQAFDTDDELADAMSSGSIDARIVSSSYRDGSRIIAKFAPMNYYVAVPKAENDVLQELNDAMINIQTDMPDFEREVEERYKASYSENHAILSEAEKNYINATPAIKVAVSDTWFPISYFEQDGTYTGPLAEIYKKISNATGIKFEFIECKSYMEALKSIESGQTDMISEFPYDFVFADKWNVSLTNFVNDIAVYKVVNNNIDDSDIKSVAVYGETYLEEKVRKIYGDNVNYIMYDTAKEAIESVLNNTVDATFINYYKATQFQNRGKYISLRYILMPSLQYDFGLGIQENSNPLLKSIIAKGLQTIDGEYIESLFQMAGNSNKTADFETQFYQNPTLFVIGFAIIIAAIVLSIAFFIYSKRMAKKNSELERAKQAQSDFLSRMSHDMRTPMNGILGISYLMEKEDRMDTLKGYIPKLQESSNYLLQLINDVLDVNKIESGNLVLNPKICNEEKVFNSIIDLMTPLINEKKIDFHFVKNNIEWKYMLLDEQRVKQLFINLLNNAVKFTPAGGRIDFIMELESETKDVIRDKFIIRDNGVGISEEFLPHIFEAFKQEQGLSSDYTKGTGLGLPIVKQLVELMDGTIDVKSKKNEGTEFTVYVNFPVVHDVQTVDNESGETILTPIAEKTVYPYINGVNVLLCEDHPLNATIATKLLKQQGAIVTWACDGDKGVRMFTESEEGAFDIILMDIRMPNMDGLQATRAIRALNRRDAKTVPIIAMSANAYDEDIQKSLDAGMNTHLAKPIEPQKMYETIEKYIKEK